LRGASYQPGKTLAWEKPIPVSESLHPKSVNEKTLQKRGFVARDRENEVALTLDELDLKECFSYTINRTDVHFR
jgi:hypothetical protein